MCVLLVQLPLSPLSISPSQSILAFLNFVHFTRSNVHVIGVMKKTLKARERKLLEEKSEVETERAYRDPNLAESNAVIQDVSMEQSVQGLDGVYDHAASGYGSCSWDTVTRGSSGPILLAYMKPESLAAQLLPSASAVHLRTYALGCLYVLTIK